jgi:hypothetical protein
MLVEFPAKGACPQPGAARKFERKKTSPALRRGSVVLSLLKRAMDSAVLVIILTRCRGGVFQVFAFVRRHVPCTAVRAVVVTLRGPHIGPFLAALSASVEISEKGHACLLR